MISFVGGGPGDPGLITVKGRRLLEEADLVVHAGSLVNPALLDGIVAELLDSHGRDLEDIVDRMVEAHRSGKKVVRLHSGDPSLYGAIEEQMELLDEEGIPYEVVPGVSSVFASAAALKRELTSSGVANSVVLTRPAGRTLDEDRLAEFSSMEDVTLAVLLGASRVREAMETLRCPGDTPVRVVYRATWPDQKIIEGTVDTIADRVEAAGIERSAMILIGNALTAGGERSYLYGGYASE
ncbi:MAG: S-adenosyl-L-methionine-dependent uroporphyrinogen III methyltransferase [Methanonatronarchaeales archaeon]|nr:S-adenosyl-L-methionine-dependent uroporphyrinogen III methyltransferase [Methanonatronarchaeales archaeon]